MNKLISLFVFICLLSFTVADRASELRESFGVDDNGENQEYDIENLFDNPNFDGEEPLVAGETLESLGISIDNVDGATTADPISNTEHVDINEEEETWASEPMVVVQEEPVPTIQLVPTEEPEDAQLTKDGEVIVDNTGVDVVLTDPQEVAENQEDDNGEVTSVEAVENGEETEEQDFKTEDSDDVDDSDIPVLDNENGEYVFGATGVIAVENVEEKEEQDFKTEDSDDVDTSDIPVLDNENGEYVFGATSVEAVENVEEKEEQDFKTEDSDDVDGTDAPVLVSESGEYTLEPTSVVEVNETDIDKEEENFKTEDSDDVDTSSEVPVLNLENQDDNNTDDEKGEGTDVTIGENSEEVDIFKTEESDDVNDGEIPVLTSENGEFDFKPTSVIGVDGTDIDKEEQDFQPEDSDDVDDSEVAVLDLENEEGQNTDENSEAVDAIEVNETDVDKEEQDLKTEDSDDVDDSEMQVLTLTNEEYNVDNAYGEVTSVDLPTEDLTDDANEQENDNDDQDPEPNDAQAQTVDVKEDGFLP